MKKANKAGGKSSQSNENHIKKHPIWRKSIILMVTIITILLAFYLIGGYIPIFGKIIASHQIKKYCGIESIAQYDPYSGNYFTGRDTNKIIYSLKDGWLWDFSIQRESETELNKKYHAFLLQSNVWNDEDGVYPEIIGVRVKCRAGATEKYYDILIASVWDHFSGTDDEAKNHMISLFTALNDYLKRDYNITSMKYCYGNLNQYYELCADGKMRNLGDIDLVKDVLAPTVTPIDYQEWKQQNGG